MNRLDRRPSETLATWTERLQTDLDQLKSTSQTVQSSVVYHVSDSGNPYDWTGTLTTFGGNYIRQFTVTATAVHGTNITGILLGYIYVGSMASRYTGANYMADQLAGLKSYIITYNTGPSNHSTPNIRQWVVNLAGPNTTTTCFVKFYVVATDSVTITSVVSY